MTYKLKQGDQRVITLTVKQSASEGAPSVPVDLTGVTELVTKARARRSDDAVPFALPTTIAAAVGGKVDVTIDGTWPVGEYFIQLDFKGADGKPHKAPNEGYAVVEVEASMADPPS